MNEIEKQILKNQIYIIETTARGGKGFSERMEETSKLLNPKQIEESACDMKEDRICGECGNPLGSDKGCDKCEEYERNDAKRGRGE